MKRGILLLLLVTLLPGCVLNTEDSLKRDLVTNEAAKEIYHRSYFMDRDFFDRSYEGVEVKSYEEKVAAGIVPHHLLASYLMAEFFEGLEKNNQPEVVVLIGPNHRELGNFGILSSRAVWQTPYGDLEPDEEIVETLVERDILEIDEKMFVGEHSISSLVSFIKKSFPDARLVPIVLKTRVRTENILELSETLAEVLPEKSLVIASLDFAHEVSSEDADTLDKKSLEVLENLDLANIEEITVDSIPTVSLLLNYLDLKGIRQSILIANSNAAKVTRDFSIQEVTSYITMYFY